MTTDTRLVEASAATRYRCLVSTDGPHTAGDGKPRRKACAYCGSSLRVQSGLWGVFEWTASNRYPVEDAKRTFTRQGAAQDYADQRDLVVRWIPDPADDHA
jgi:hypothetical protein